MKKILVEIKDDTKTTMVEPVAIHHLSDLGDGVKEVVDEFIKANAGTVIPPVTIKAVEEGTSERGRGSDQQSDFSDRCARVRDFN